MDTRSLIDAIVRFASHVSLDQLLKQLSDLETFKDRVSFAEKHFEHLSSGSSRVIYLTDDKQVLKLAKNDRGIAQNKVEGNPKMKSEFVNRATKVDPNGIWNLSKYREKITEKEFEKLVGVPFKDFSEALDYGMHDDSGKKPKDFEKLSKLPIYKEMVRLGKEFQLLSGDITRISSWGVADGVPVLLDSGLTRKVYDEFYTSKDETSKPKTS